MSFVVTLPNGQTKLFTAVVTVFDIAKAISISLSKSALCGLVDQQLVDLSYVIDRDATVSIVTADSALSLEVIRHSTAHLLAHAVKILYADVQVTIGPVIDNGFYYDFYCEHKFTPDDLPIIEAKMAELACNAIAIDRIECSRDEAIEYFTELGETYKVAIIEQITDTTVSLYRQGDFTDLCRGPHVPNTKFLKVFKLTKISGAYWRGDSSNQMLQRIYGTAWTNHADMQQYRAMLDEAERRDHRKIGATLDLFHLQDNAPGMVFWHPKGWVIWQEIEQYMRSMFKKYNYLEVKTPQIVQRGLWELSGHWDKFKDDMFVTIKDDVTYAIKPMNCPCHVQIFNQGIKSYRQLPIRIAEFGSCHRNEASGALHGLMRTLNFTQDDAHIFCSEEQLCDEVGRFCDMLFEVYKKFGLHEVQIKLSTRPAQRIGDDATWDRAEAALQSALMIKQLEFGVMKGEGAFYGPKIEFVLRDCIGRSWTLGSIQLDFSMPNRLGASYIDHNGNKQVPVMLHRAICGSMERFIAILIEHYAGRLPFWLTPIQFVVFGVTEKLDDYVLQVRDRLLEYNFRCVADIANQKVNYKIREYTLQKIPYLLIVGDVERSNGTVSIRQNDGKQLNNISFEELLALCNS